MPQCLLRIARFRGFDRSEFLDNRQFNCNAFTLLANAERFLRETLPIAGRFESDRMVRIDEPLHPPLAIREAPANALRHRDYSLGGGSVGVAVCDDRLEGTSTGPLHFGPTPGDLFAARESRPWNPLIAGTFHRRGIIEEWGRGTIRMAELAASAGLPRPEIEDIGDCVKVCFRRIREVPCRESGADPTVQQSTILRLLRVSDHPLALREIRSLAGQRTNERRLREDLAILKSKRLAEPRGRGRGARWKALWNGPFRLNSCSLENLSFSGHPREHPDPMVRFRPRMTMIRPPAPDRRLVIARRNARVHPTIDEFRVFEQTRIRTSGNGQPGACRRATSAPFNAVVRTPTSCN